MPRNRRLISPATAGGVLLLALLAAMIVVGTLVADRNSVAGLPVAYTAPIPVPTAPVAPQGTPEPAPPPADNPAPGAAAPPAAAQPPPVPVPHASVPGTIRLAHGGTATMVRREIGDDGVLPIPNAINQASWWGAAIDAASGATVLAGHVNWKGATGPFAELWDSRAGDQMSIVDGSGRPVGYQVTQVITLAKDELPRRAAELFAQSGPHRLVLVTCGGQWVGGKIGYASNQIVIATPA
jgi:sortase family protein